MRSQLAAAVYNAFGGYADLRNSTFSRNNAYDGAVFVTGGSFVEVRCDAPAGNES